MTEMRRSTSGAAVEIKPQLDRIEPAQGSSAGNERVTITGTGLANIRRIRFGNEEARDVKPMSPTKVTCLTPSYSPGQVKVFVIDEGHAESNKLTFTYK